MLIRVSSHSHFPSRYEEHLFAAVSANKKQTMMWAPGEATVNNSTIHVVWSGWPQNGPPDGWKGDFTHFTSLRQPVVLSGPFYLTPAHPAWNVWQKWHFFLFSLGSSVRHVLTFQNQSLKQTCRLRFTGTITTRATLAQRMHGSMSTS